MFPCRLHQTPGYIPSKTAMKCNNDEKIVDVLMKLGSSFDCASKAEIQQVLELGVDPSRIIYANPCKQNSHLTYAKEHNVDLMTFDTEEELIKVKMLYGSARLLRKYVWSNVRTGKEV
ncbi:ornithine decarboxylase-like [Mizuhopecten yessoensis]|uniref:ornithine decarboxylase-like n=1 Tax=Mizuhopecten yessoensis TaxID=6573 RepID=UPI000B45C87F|nr:ornithine decarboxylase-like [Mizuhopecten yessoensis]